MYFILFWRQDLATAVWLCPPVHACACRFQHPSCKEELSGKRLGAVWELQKTILRGHGALGWVHQSVLLLFSLAFLEIYTGACICSPQMIMWVAIKVPVWPLCSAKQRIKNTTGRCLPGRCQIVWHVELCLTVIGHRQDWQTLPPFEAVL